MVSDFQQRAIDESVALDEKITKLAAFISTADAYTKLHVDEQVRLRMQIAHMRAYAAVLQERISAFLP